MGKQSLAGKTALITGASRGLGRAMALALAEAGAGIMMAARGGEALAATAAELRKLQARVETFQADVSDEAQVLALERAVRERCDRIDILINNAGINIRKPITEFPLSDWHAVMETNVTSVFLMCRAFVPHMKGRGYGRILNLTSIMSHVSLPGRTAYSTSKTALLGFTRALALELASDKITVNGISPGVFETEFNQPLFNNPEVSAQFLSKIPLGRWGQPEEVGKLALYLCSDDASYITGTDFVIDGGWTAQ